LIGVRVSGTPENKPTTFYSKKLHFRACFNDCGCKSGCSSSLSVGQSDFWFDHGLCLNEFAGDHNAPLRPIDNNTISGDADRLCTEMLRSLNGNKFLVNAFTLYGCTPEECSVNNKRLRQSWLKSGYGRILFWMTTVLAPRNNFSATPAWMTRIRSSPGRSNFYTAATITTSSARTTHGW